MGESPTQHGNNDQHIQYVSDMLYMSGRVYIYIILFFFSFLFFSLGQFSFLLAAWKNL